MSYDIQVWSVQKPDLVEIASNLEGWKRSEHLLVFQKKAWQIVIGPSSQVEEEDIPEEVFKTLPGIQHLTEMNLEPIHAPESARKRLLSTGNRIAKSSYGVVYDPQKDTISSPRGVKRVVRSKSPDRIPVFNFTWWFDDSPLMEEGGLRKFLSILEKYLPEAIPRRYGSFEPPQYKFDIQGKEHFIEFLSKEMLSVIWYPHYPVLHIWPSITGGFGARRQGYRTYYLTIMVDASIWTQSGWDIAFRRAWFEISNHIRPFFGEVRVLRNYILQRGRPYSDGKTEAHPVRNGWWNGVPKHLGVAVVIDNRYAELWRKFVNKSEQSNGLFYVSSEDWISGRRVDQLVGRIPRGIAQGKYDVPTSKGLKTTYPKQWPFEYPFIED
jgi:hypothetical protein